MQTKTHKNCDLDLLAMTLIFSRRIEVVEEHVRAKFQAKCTAAVHELSCYQRGKKTTKKLKTILPSLPRAATIQESPANAKGTCDNSACMKAHCEQM